MIHPHLLPPDLPAARVRACVGLIADTHMPERWPALPDAVFAVFAGIDLILHAGDVGELWVLDQLSRCAPVVAVHGNDDSRDSQRELPYQQVVTVAGQRILLWHSHYPDRVDEMESRRSDEIIPKLARSVQRAQRAGAAVAVFGHWHLPLVYADQGVLVVNPGALASGNGFMRQLRQTVALLLIVDDGSLRVRHVDLARPHESYAMSPLVKDPGFAAALCEYNAMILEPALAAHSAAINRRLGALGYDKTLPALLRVAHRCWAGAQEWITHADWVAEVTNDPDLSPSVRAEYLALLRDVARE